MALGKAFMVGTISGMRTLAGPALVSHKVQGRVMEGPPSLIGSRRMSRVLTFMAFSELIMDKLPIPPRTAPVPLLARIASGAIAGGAIAGTEGSSTTGGALVGGLAAAAGAFGFYQARRRAVRRTGLPDPLLGLGEDLLLLAAGAALIGEKGNSRSHGFS